MYIFTETEEWLITKCETVYSDVRKKSETDGFCFEKWDRGRLASVNKYYKLSVL